MATARCLLKTCCTVPFRLLFARAHQGIAYLNPKYCLGHCWALWLEHLRPSCWRKSKWERQALLRMSRQEKWMQAYPSTLGMDAMVRKSLRRPSSHASSARREILLWDSLCIPDSESTRKMCCCLFTKKKIMISGIWDSSSSAECVHSGGSRPNSNRELSPSLQVFAGLAQAFTGKFARVTILNIRKSNGASCPCRSS